MTMRENPELVTTGPYRLVRHPIYSGFILAFIGSYLVTSQSWMLLLVICVPYFIYSAVMEERLMDGQFPDQYADYKKRTKMLIPFLF